MEKIYVRDEFGRMTAVDQHPVTKVKGVLCIWNSRTGSADKKFEVTMEKCEKWVGFIANGYLLCQSVWTGI